MQIIPGITIPLDLTRHPEQFQGDRHGGCVSGDLILRQGKVVGMRPGAKPIRKPKLLIPPVSEAHCHLDKCHTIQRLTFEGGDLPAAIQAQRDDKRNWTPTDIRQRALRGLCEASAAGCHSLRSHVDWSDSATPPLSWHVLLELAQEAPMKVQLSPLTGINQMADKAFAGAVARLVPAGHALGALVLGHSDMHAGLRNMFEMADKHGLPLDFHVDETLDPAMNGLEAIADVALQTGFGGPILCGHAVSLTSRSRQDFNRIADKLARAGVAVVALPTTNLYLQGRNSHAATQRGLTPLVALSRAGVRVVLSNDNVRDAFCPVGRHDPMQALEMGILCGHLSPPLGRWMRAITTDARRAMGLAAMHIDETRLENLRVADASDPSEVISGAAHRPATELLKEVHI